MLQFSYVFGLKRRSHVPHELLIQILDKIIINLLQFQRNAVESIGTAICLYGATIQIYPSKMAATILSSII